MLDTEYAKREQELRARHAAYMASLEAEYAALSKRIDDAHAKLDVLGAPPRATVAK